MSSNNKIQALLFDLDGTLLNTQDGIICSVKYTMQTLNLPEIGDDELCSFVGPPIQDSLRNHFGLSMEEAQSGAEIFRNYYQHEALYRAYVYEGVMDFLDYLKHHDIKMAVATYKREDYAIQILNYFGITQFCDVIHGADNENKLTKADIVEICVYELGCDKKSVALVGDTNHDAIGAMKAGVSFIAVTWGFGYKRNNPQIEYPYIGIANEMRDIGKFI
ncbi:HAD family hydrolase [Bacteroides intestinalis]|jgi:phosphoglycolate phosphatase|uniref:HAD family hydrolase n=1 Tax=Bacteroides intestinalis TaxID=329854 RepID=A0A412XRD5_9BACE|nr:HAD hydrolase-like protein [Bacteroides intestinalis]RGV47726.1 HAD family hydrolase [Bacteroides intestinalis]RHA53664.1 HAD family hydrolase [Bacteroides intestinalis]